MAAGAQTMSDMANSALYVKLDKETYERLRRLSAAERRQPGDQAALLLREILEKLIEPVAA